MPTVVCGTWTSVCSTGRPRMLQAVRTSEATARSAGHSRCTTLASVSESTRLNTARLRTSDGWPAACGPQTARVSTLSRTPTTPSCVSTRAW